MSINFIITENYDALRLLCVSTALYLSFDNNINSNNGNSNNDKMLNRSDSCSRLLIEWSHHTAEIATLFHADHYEHNRVLSIFRLERDRSIWICRGCVDIINVLFAITLGTYRFIY